MNKSICFIGLDNYSVMNPAKTDNYIGGESVQQSLIAKAFAARGWDVSMIVKDHGQPDGEVIGGVRMLKAFRQDAGLPVIRFFHPKITSLRRCMAEAGADIYYHSCAGFITGVAAHFCRARGKSFVFRLAHDTDCIPGQQLISNIRDRKIYEHGLRRAHVIYAQSDRQIRLLRDNYGLDSQYMPMAVETPSPSEAGDKSIDVLWVNNIRQFKRPDLYVELSKMLPSVNFTMIGGLWGMEKEFGWIREEARDSANLDYKGFVPYSEVNDYFARTRIFVNTSDSEGFPNTFLQAWMRGVPVVSFFDPDGIIAGKGLGTVPKDFSEMRRVVEQLLSSGDELSQLSERVRTYALENHAPNSVAEKYEASFQAAFGK